MKNEEKTCAGREEEDEGEERVLLSNSFPFLKPTNVLAPFISSSL